MDVDDLRHVPVFPQFVAVPQFDIGKAILIVMGQVQGEGAEKKNEEKTAIERYITVIPYKWFTIRYDRGGGMLRNDIRTCKFAREYTC